MISLDQLVILLDLWSDVNIALAPLLGLFGFIPHHSPSLPLPYPSPDSLVFSLCSQIYVYP